MTRGTAAIVLGVLVALFIGRVVGQILAATIAPTWLPPMARWYSGLMPYRYLLPVQILFIAVMVMMISGVASGAGALGTYNATVGRWIIRARRRACW